MQQRVIVSGGATGLGLSIAKAFAASGAKVLIGDIDRAALAEATAGGEIAGIACDISNPEQVQAFMDQASAQLGGLDVLVNNTGLAGPTTSVEDLAFEEWRRVVDVNLNGTFLMTKAAIPHLKAAGGGSIIIMSSVSGRMGHPNRSPYATTKWGLVGFAKTLARELGGFNIRANAIMPGAVDNDRTRRVMAAHMGIDNPTDQDLAAALRHGQSIPKLVPMKEIAELAVFLASDNATTISGQTLPIDGDMRAG